MVLKDSGDIRKENWLSKAELDEKDCFYISENMSGDIITEIKISKIKKIVYLCC